MFRRNEGEDRLEPIQASEVRTPTGDVSEVTVVGKGAHLDGNLISAGSLQIDGRVSGKIAAEGDVRLSPQSQVEADIDATNVVVAGSFKGNINARSRTELSAGGRVDGNITSQTLIVSEGAFFSGQSIMNSQGSQGRGPQGVPPRSPEVRPAGAATPAPTGAPASPPSPPAGEKPRGGTEQGEGTRTGRPS